jgi:transposase
VAIARRLYIMDHELSAAAIAARLGVSPTTVLRWLDQGGIARRPPAHARSAAARLPIAREQLEELYVRQGLDQAQVAAELGVSKGTVLNRLRELGIPVRRRRFGAPHDPLSPDVLEQLYVRERRLSEREIGERFGVNRTRVQRRLKAYGIPTRSHRGIDHTETLPSDCPAAPVRGAPFSITDIAREFGLSHDRVRAALVAHGIALRPQGRLGSGGRPPLSKALLETLYVEHGMTMGEIARCLGYVTKVGTPSVQRVASALDAAGIPRRSSLHVAGTRRRPDLDPALLRELYEDQELSGKEISQMLGVNLGTSTKAGAAAEPSALVLRYQPRAGRSRRSGGERNGTGESRTRVVRRLRPS